MRPAGVALGVRRRDPVAVVRPGRRRLLPRGGGHRVCRRSTAGTKPEVSASKPTSAARRAAPTARSSRCPTTWRSERRFDLGVGGWRAAAVFGARADVDVGRLRTRRLGRPGASGADRLAAGPARPRTLTASLGVARAFGPVEIGAGVNVVPNDWAGAGRPGVPALAGAPGGLGRAVRRRDRGRSGRHRGIRRLGRDRAAGGGIVGDRFGIVAAYRLRGGLGDLHNPAAGTPDVRRPALDGAPRGAAGRRPSKSASSGGCGERRRGEAAADRDRVRRGHRRHRLDELPPHRAVRGAGAGRCWPRTTPPPSRTGWCSCWARWRRTWWPWGAVTGLVGSADQTMRRLALLTLPLVAGCAGAGGAAGGGHAAGIDPRRRGAAGGGGRPAACASRAPWTWCCRPARRGWSARPSPRRPRRSPRRPPRRPAKSTSSPPSRRRRGSARSRKCDGRKGPRRLRPCGRGGRGRAAAGVRLGGRGRRRRGRGGRADLVVDGAGAARRPGGDRVHGRQGRLQAARAHARRGARRRLARAADEIEFRSRLEPEARRARIARWMRRGERGE